jgi:hypothetical protein
LKEPFVRMKRKETLR